jgi:exonuclease 3'-5' domain-containing protein 1
LKHTYLIDVHVLGEKAFTTISSDGLSLQAILEDASIPKVFFDVRNDSDALYGLHNIALNGIKDVQLMELATRKESRDWLAGLLRCVETDISDAAVKTAWRHVKEQGTWLYRPAKGGKYEVFDERPLKAEIAEYCAGDVALLPELYAVYDGQLKGRGFWQSMVERATGERIKESQSEGYVGQGKEKAKGPWTVSLLSFLMRRILLEAKLSEGLC